MYVGQYIRFQKRGLVRHDDCVVLYVDTCQFVRPLQNDSTKMQQVSAEKLDEELTVARLYINKMKSEVKNVVQRCSHLEVVQVEGNQKLGEMEKSLSDNRLLIEQVLYRHV